MKKEIILHIPHSSYYVPDEYNTLFYLSKNDLFKEQLKMTDSYTDELFNILYVTKHIFPISRLVCDVERFRNEDDEEMSKQGMWVCYERTSDLKPLKKVNDSHKKEILEKYYDLHHSRFEQLTEEKLFHFGKCLIIDAHSFSSEPLPYELHAQKTRPDICIGTDIFHTPDKITKYLYFAFTKLNYKVGINTPFCGTIVPLKYYRQNNNVMSVMIEINRKLYMNEKTGEKNNGFNKINNDIVNVVKNL